MKTFLVTGLLLSCVLLLWGIWWVDQATTHRFPVWGSGYLEVEDAYHLAEENQSIDIWYVSRQVPRALVYREYYSRSLADGTPSPSPNLALLKATLGPGHRLELTLDGKPFFTFRPPPLTQPVPFPPQAALSTGAP
jgi:hypothetical protein